MLCGAAQSAFALHFGLRALATSHCTPKQAATRPCCRSLSRCKLTLSIRADAVDAS